MSVTNVKRSAETASGSHNRGGEHKYEARYSVTVDNAQDGPHTIANYLEANGYPIGIPYEYGPESDLLSFLSGITSTRKDKSLFEWDVVLSYEPADPGQNEERSTPGGSGERSSDPISWEVDFSIGTSLIQVPAWKAWNVDAFPLGGAGSGYARTANTLGAVVNSAGVVLDPGLMRTVAEVTIRIRKNLTIGDVAHTNYANKLNSAQVQFPSSICTNYSLAACVFPVHTLRCFGVVQTYRRTNATRYFESDWDIRYRCAADTINPLDKWYETVLDRGISRRAISGDPDGRGGTISANDVKTAMARTAAIRDVDGARAAELVLLDGHGQPASSDSAGVFFRWRLDGEMDFSAMPHLFFEVPS